MNPTCGPFPWVMATSHPSLIIEAMCQHVSPAAMYWSRTVWWNLSLISEFPPIATTAVFLAMARPFEDPCAGKLFDGSEDQRQQRHPRDDPVERLEPVAGVPGGVDVGGQLVHPRQRVQHDGVALGLLHEDVPGDLVLGRRH